MSIMSFRFLDSPGGPVKVADALTAESEGVTSRTLQHPQAMTAVPTHDLHRTLPLLQDDRSSVDELLGTSTATVPQNPILTQRQLLTKELFEFLEQSQSHGRISS